MKLIQIDAFTDQPFRGNPAAVCLLDRERDSRWMQHVAAEMNLAETAFLLRGDDAWSLRWFTPTVEVDLCGHATLASAHALWEEKADDAATLRFQTRSGLLTASRLFEGNVEWIELDFPAMPEKTVEAPPELLDALGVRDAVYVGRNRFDYLVEVKSEDEVRAVDPNHAELRKLPMRGVIVTSRGANGQYDFVSRFFAPGSGVDEDPATGSAHCCLAPYWAPRLGKNEFVAWQASARGAMLRVRLDGERVKLGGRAVTVLRGELVV
jgi:PhzF family phenazine biosynthesis protein